MQPRGHRLMPKREERLTMVSKELLEILACPACKTPVRLDDTFIVCDACGRRYPVRDGIPVMLIEEGDKWRLQTGGPERG